MAKKTAEQFIIELKEIYVDRQLSHLEKMLTIKRTDLSIEEMSLQEELDKEEIKFLKNINSKLKYVEKLNNELTGKTGKEKSTGQSDLMGRILEMKSSMGKIVRTIPQTGTD